MAEENPAPQSLVMWVASALGVKFGLFIALAAIVAFVLTLAVVIRGKAASAGSALAFIVPLPALVGLFGAMEELVATFSVLSRSDVEIKVAQLALVATEAVIRPMAGLLAIAPSYLLAMTWLLIRSFRSDKSS